AFDGDRNGCRCWKRLIGEQKAWSKRAGAVIDLCLRQIERVFAFDVTRAHVVADGVASDLAAWVEQQRQFRLGHRPLRIGSNANRLAGPDNATGCGLKK